MLLSIHERLSLLNMLPREGSVITLRILRDFQHDLAVTEEEKKKIKLKEANGTLTWDDTLETAKEIEVGDTMKELIVAALKARDASKKLTMQQLPLYERFLPPGDS